MRVLRAGLGGAGLILVAVGVRHLFGEDRADISNATVWLGAGVLAHDALVAPATLVIVYVALRSFPTWLVRPAAVGFVVLATVTVAAVPVLGRFGARPDNPTLLDRDYVAGWLVFAATVVVGVAVAAVRQRTAHSDRIDP